MSGGETVRHHDLARLQRIGARFLGAGFIGYLVVSLGTLLNTAHLTAPWWPPLSVLLAIGPGAALLAASFRPGTGWLGPLAIAASLGFLLACGLWFLAWNGGTIDESQGAPVWLVFFSGMPSMALMLIYPAYSLIHLVVSSVMASLAQQLGRTGEIRWTVLIDIAWAITFTGVFLAIVLVAVRTADLLDRTRDATYRAAAYRAAGSARDAERRRLDSVIHDRVIASLLAVEPGRPGPRLAAQAASALAELERQAVRDTGSPVMAADAVRRIRSTVAGFDDTVMTDLTVGASATAPYPAEVIDALIEAMGEAVRNSLRHAGPAARAVIGDFEDGSVRLAVVDDGIGFEPAAMPPARLGIAISIAGRMAQLPGGYAAVESVPGGGATVWIRWDRPS